MPVRVTLLTDFGTADGYVGAVKGVLATAAPHALVEDVSHDVPRGDVRSARYALARYWRLYPEGTIHLVVVDPGVGTERRALACEADGRFFVAPDNGVLGRALSEASAWRAVEIVHVETPESVPGGRSSTFHGRDVFAPAAARLASGDPLEALGPPVPRPVLADEPEPVRKGSEASGVVVAVDRFGNLRTNLPGAWLGPRSRVHAAGRTLHPVPTYGAAHPGEAVALVGSDGYVELAVRDGSAAEVLGGGPGLEVRMDVRD